MLDVRSENHPVQRNIVSTGQSVQVLFRPDLAIITIYCSKRS